MSESSGSDGAEGFGTLLLGGAIGFGLYMLVTGSGSGFGQGRGEGVITQPRDEARLNFLLSPRGFEPRDADWKPVAAKIYALQEVIARVKDGGRSDVALKISGDAIQGVVDAALAAFKQAGIDVFILPSARVAGDGSGNARGEYGRRGARW